MIRLQPNLYSYRRRLPHIQKTGRPLFVSFRKLSKEPFCNAARDLVLQHCLHDNGKRYTLYAVVVMPEHVHLLLTPMHDADGWPIPLQFIMKLIKGISARSVNRLAGAEGPVWQEESFDYGPRSHEDFLERAEYIRQNPVRRGLVEIPEDYPWLWIDPEIKAQLRS